MRQPLAHEDIPALPLTETWAGAVCRAFTKGDDGLLYRSSAPQEQEATGTEAVATLRAWIYADVHVRSGADIAAHRSYADLPFSSNLLSATYASVGWRAESGALTHPEWPIMLANGSHHPDGFGQHDSSVELPRLRCGTAPGWLTVCSTTGAASRQAHRIYLPGVDLDQVEQVVEILDSSPGFAWSLKSSTGIDRDRHLVSRADQTVVYVDLDRHGATDVSSILDQLSTVIPCATGPGFSVPLRPGICFGGRGQRHGSFGTYMAHLSAQALLTDDFAELAIAEGALRDQARRLEEDGSS